MDNLVRQHENKLILLGGIFLAFLLRYSLREMETLDFKDFTGPWYDFIVQHGGLQALRFDFANYTPPYLYLLVIVTTLFSGFSKVFAIKLVSILFDFICAFFVYRMVQLKYGTSSSVPLFAFLAILFAPTVFLNSAFWGQADAIYTAGLVATVYFLLAKRPFSAFIAFGLAFTFKLQAIFLAPFLLILLVGGAVSWRLFLLVPLVYTVAMVPAWVAGRPLTELLLIYATQAGFYQELTMNAANLYQWLPNDQYDVLYPMGLVLATAVSFLFVVAVYKSRVLLTAEIMVQLATISVILLPYFLPKMHDRYFFAADVFTIVYAFFFPSYFYIPVLMGLVSLSSYGPFLFGREWVPLELAAVAPLFILLFLFHHLAQTAQIQLTVKRET